MLNEYESIVMMLRLYGQVPSFRPLLADELGISTTTLASTMRAIRSLLNVLDPLSFSRALGEDGGTLEDYVFDTDELIENKMSADEVYQFLFRAIRELPKREQTILIKRFGLGGVRAQGYGEIGHIHNLSHERIRQLEQKAIDSLRKKHPELEGLLSEREE